MNLNKLLASFALASISVSLVGCLAEAKKDGTPALFNTKAEAEKAAKNFNCAGAHKMGDKWMPCEKHEDHEILEKKNTQEGHGHHHNH